jgi:hypothetical protein
VTTNTIANICILGLLADLTDEFARSVGGETLEVGVLRAGELQENPVNPKVAVLVKHNEPGTEGWRDGSVAQRDEALERNAVNIPAYEVGGSAMWWRRFLIEWSWFGTKTKETREEARQQAEIITARIERAVLASTHVTTSPPDDFGETPIKVFHIDSKMEESGGPPKSFIWRGWVRVQVLTNRPI